jgi:hypothetical protein
MLINSVYLRVGKIIHYVRASELVNIYLQACSLVLRDEN